MKLRVRLEGFEGVGRALARVAPARNRARELGMVSAMEAVLDLAARDYLRGPRPRRIDKVTGDLIRSLRVDRRRLPRRVEAGSPLEYSAVHEYGRGGRRGFLAPAFYRLRSEIVEHLEAAWAGEIRAAFRSPGRR